MATMLNVEQNDASVGVFITPQSLFTFPVATSVVTMVWKMCGQVEASLEQNKLIPVGLALCIGALIYLLSESAAETRKAKILEGLTGFLNSLMIASASLGIMHF